MILALRQPEAVRGLLLWRVTGGARRGAARQSVLHRAYRGGERGRHGGGVQLEHWKEVIAANPASRER